MSNDRLDLLTSMMQTNSELLVYVVSSPDFKLTTLASMMTDGSISVEIVLGKLPLFLPLLEQEP